MPLRRTTEDKLRTVFLPKLLSDLQAFEPRISSIHLFGSRRWEEVSVRSDIDLLVSTVDDAPLSHEFAEAVWDLEPYLDVFHESRGIARSLVNESQIREASTASLVSALEAVLVWESDQWVGDPALESHRVLKERTPAMTLAELFELRDPSRRDFAAVIVTALPEEFAAVVAAASAESVEALRAEAMLGRVSRDERWIAIECANRPGPAPIAVTAFHGGATTKAPLIILCGITAGIRGRAEPGDLVVPETIVDYELAKLTPWGKEPGFRSSRTSDSFRREAAALAQAEWRPSETCFRLAPRRPRVAVLTDSVLASGAKVVASGKVARSIAKFHRKAVAIEMEGAGVAEAAAALQCDVAVVKAVSDQADSAKGDEWHPFAMLAAAEFTVAVLRQQP